MAEKKEKEERKIVLERTYIVPLRREWLKVPKYKRAKKAATALRQFAAKHMKAEIVKIGKYINLELWKHGIKNPPHKVKVICTKDDKGIVFVEMVGAPAEKAKVEKKAKVAKKPVEAKVVEEASEPSEEPKKEESKKEAPKADKPKAAKPAVKKAAPKAEE